MVFVQVVILTEQQNIVSDFQNEPMDISKNVETLESLSLFFKVWLGLGN